MSRSPTTDRAHATLSKVTLAVVCGVALCGAVATVFMHEQEDEDVATAFFRTTRVEEHKASAWQPLPQRSTHEIVAPAKSPSQALASTDARYVSPHTHRPDVSITGDVETDHNVQTTTAQGDHQAESPTVTFTPSAQSAASQSRSASSSGSSYQPIYVPSSSDAESEPAKQVASKKTTTQAAVSAPTLTKPSQVIDDADDSLSGDLQVNDLEVQESNTPKKTTQPANAGTGQGGGSASTSSPSTAPATTANDNAGPGGSAPLQREQVNPKLRIVALYFIGGTADDPANRMVGHRLNQTGWGGFVEDKILPDLVWGVRRIQLHNPFGDDPDKRMSFTQYLEAQQAGLDWLSEGFVEAWKPVIDGAYTGGEPVEVIAYIGSAMNDASMEALYQAGQLDEWYERAFACVQPLLDAGTSIALDNSGVVPAEHPHYQFAVMLQEMGVKVYMEAWPRTRNPHWARFSPIIAENFYRVARNHPKQLVPRQELPGRPIRMVTGHAARELAEEGDRSYELPMVIEVLSEGDNVAVMPDRIMEAGITIDDILREAELRAMAQYD